MCEPVRVQFSLAVVTSALRRGLYVPWRVDNSRCAADRRLSSAETKFNTASQYRQDARVYIRCYPTSRVPRNFPAGIGTRISRLYSFALFQWAFERFDKLNGVTNISVHV